jgi:hypothetical protein
MDLDTIMIPLPFYRFRKVFPFLVGVLLAVAGAYMIAYATRWGPWAGSDSVEYVEAARNIAAGKGLVLVRASGRVVPLYLRPPLYSLVLAGLLALGLDAIEAGRFLAISLFFCLVLMPSVLSQQVEDKYALPLGIAAYILASPNLVHASTGLMSESLFMLLSLMAIGLAVGSLCYRRRALMPVAAVLAGLAWLTRFAGAACLLVVALVPLLENQIRLGRRIVRAMSAALIGALPFAVWTLSVRAAGYTPGVYTLPVGNLWDALQPVRVAYVDMLWEWLPLRLLIPIDSYRSRAAILLLLCAILAWSAARLLLRLEQHSGSIDSQTFVSTTGLLLLLFAIAHALVVAISFLVVALPKPAIDQRVLLPSQITFAAGLVLVLYSSVMHLRIPMVRLALPLAFILPSIWTGWPSTWLYVRQLNEEGGGYTSRSWQQSPIVDVIKDLSPSLSIVSNDPDAVAVYAQRPAFQIPELEDGRLPSAWVPFGSEPQSEPEMLFAQGRAALVLFSQGRYQFSQLYGENAPERLSLLVGGLEILYEASDGGIYISPNP